jgi:ATP-dependent helicase HrpA
VRVPREAWALDKLPPHLRMTFRVEDDEGRLVAKGKDLAELRAATRPRLRAELAQKTASIERHGLTSWTLGALPREVTLPGAGDAVRGYPALVDEGDAVGVRVLDTPAAQRAAMRLATRRLLLLAIAPPIREVQQRVGAQAQLALVTAPHGSVGKALADATLAALDALVDEAGGPAWDEAAWKRLRAHVAGRLTARTTDVVQAMARVLLAAREVERRLDDVADPRFAEQRHDVAAQLGGLVFPGFAAATGAARLPDVERYLEAAARRLERLPLAPGLDADRMRVVQELEALRRARLDALPKDRPLPAGLLEARWLIEELRVSFFAQHVGVRGAVSAKRIRKLIAESA